MRFLLGIVDALVGFVRRNPVLVLLIVVLALTAPALLKGIAMVVLYILAGFVLLVVLMLLAMRWHVYRLRRTMRGQFGEGFDAQNFGDARTGAQGREGEVNVHKTPSAPEKKVSRNVGDYVEFEETTEETKED